MIADRVTDECVIRPGAALPQGAELIQAGAIMPGDACGYAHRILLARFGQEYATWHAAYPDDDAPAYCFTGHYFDNVEEAAADYGERVKRGY